MTTNISTTAQGNAFRDEVMQLIKLRPNCREVHAEHQIGSQPVDLYYEERTSWGALRIACECKAHEKPLTKAYIAEKIVPRYGPLVEKGSVDRVRIIASKPIAATAGDYIRTDLRAFSFSTRTELEAEIIDFSAYVRALEGLYSESGLDKYYIMPTIAGGDDLENRILQWVDSDSAQPVAVLGGYGMGKTSFARRLAHIAARRFHKDARSRIPILISLSEISSEQRVDGLLARLLTSDGLVSNYSWPLFSALNSLGRFLMILDGFDEMKHTMTWAQFKYNFVQLNKLAVANSKVLLLGRPSAFASDDEHAYILAGKRRHGDQFTRVPDAPIYTELHLKEFFPSQALDFMTRYAAAQGPVMAEVRGEGYDAHMLKERLDRIANDPELMTLVLRPVQAKMLADLAMDPGVQWRSFSRYGLYAEFIERIIQREVEKPTRSAFAFDERLDFHRLLAWMLWTRAQGSGFKLVDLPPDFLGRFAREDLDIGDDSAIARDLISGSLLERKTGDSYFFPHRSFVEFLVADLLCSEEMDSTKLNAVSSSLNDEVADFIKESGRTGIVADWANLIDQIRGTISLRLMSLIAWAQNRNGSGAPQATTGATPHDIMLAQLRLIDSGASVTDIVNFLGHAFYAVASSDAKTSCIRGLIFAARDADAELKQAIWNQIGALVLVSCLEEFRRALGSHTHGSTAMQMNQPLVRAFAESCTRNAADGEIAVRIDAVAFCRWVHRALGHTWEAGGLDLGHTGESLVVGLNDLGQLNSRLKISQEGRTVIAFLKAFPNPKDLVNVHHRIVGRIRRK
jgi:hypothetical protein